MGAKSGSTEEQATGEALEATRTKEASALVYLVEELGDARMRCDQLLRYVDRATKLIEKSSHKDHFFEVAGDLIRAIPETSFKLHKALQAVALAANRIDYEEIKQDLRPEKAEELERVLKDVRVRQVQRRSLPMVNPATVVEQLRGLAKQARSEGKLDTDGLATLIASLEEGLPRVAENPGEKAAAQLDAMTHALEHPPKDQMPSAVRLAQALRKTYAEHVELTAGKKLEGEAALEFQTALLGVKEILAGRGNPKRKLFVVLSSLAKGCAHLNQDDLHDIVWKAALGVNSRWSASDAADYQKQAALPHAENIARVLEIGAKELRKSAAAFEKGEDQLAWLNLHVGVGKISSALHMARENQRTAQKLAQELLDLAGAADPGTNKAASDEEKRSRYEEGKSADPTENMSEEDAKAWKDNTDEHGDKFKKEAKGDLNMMLPPPGLPQYLPTEAATSIEGAIYSLKMLHKQLTATTHVRAGGVSHAFKEAISDLGAAAWNLNLPALSSLLDKAKLTVRLKSASDEDGDESLEKAASVEDPEPLDVEVLEGTLDTLLADAKFARTFGRAGNYKKMFFNLMKTLADVHGICEGFGVPGVGVLQRVTMKLHPYASSKPAMKFGADEEKQSRYEEGKSADPTENMSEEDAKAWKDNTEEHKDNFKSAASKLPAPSGKVVQEIRDWHGGQGSKLYSVGSRWYGGHDVEPDDAEEAYDELVRLKANRRVLQEFKEHLKEHGIKVAGDKEAFGYNGRLYVEYTKGGHSRREGPFDSNVAKRRLVALLEDGSISHVEIERRDKHAAELEAAKRGPAKSDPKVINELTKILMEDGTARSRAEDTAEDYARKGITPQQLRKNLEKHEKDILDEMGDLLEKHGYDRKDAKKIREEDGGPIKMGPHELEQRLKRPESLERDFKLKKKASAEDWKAA